MSASVSEEVDVHVCMVTPHMPPEQAANALLPSVLAREFAQAGCRTTFLTHPAQGSPRSALGRTALRQAAGTRASGSIERRCDRHGRPDWPGCSPDVARRRPRPPSQQRVHRRCGGLGGGPPRAPGRCHPVRHGHLHFDPVRHRRFAAVVRGASERVFYSRALRARAVELGLARLTRPVIYAPVDDMFRAPARDDREAVRRRLGVTGPMLLTVKRLHPVAGYEELLTAFSMLASRIPDARLFIAGSGELRQNLERQATRLASRRASASSDSSTTGTSGVLRRRGSVRSAFTARVLGNRHARGPGLRHAGRRDGDRRGTGGP